MTPSSPSPALLERYEATERATGHTFRDGQTLRQIVESGEDTDLAWGGGDLRLRRGLTGRMTDRCLPITPICYAGPMTTTTVSEPTVRELSSLDFDIDRTIAQIDQINARAAKKGLGGGYTYRVENRQDDDSQWEVLVVEGQPVKANGWTLVASVTWEGESPITGMLPGYEGPMIDRATLDGHCDICQASRVRNHVIVCEHPEQGRVVVGGQCVKDLLGHEASAFALYGRLGSLGEGSGSGRPAEYRPAFLVRVSIAATQAFGWVSRSQSSEYRAATADLVEQYLAGTWAKAVADRRRPYSIREQYRTALAILDDPATADQADQVLAWAQGLPENSEFNANLVALARAEFVSHRRVGVLAYAFTGWVRSQEQEAERKAAAAQVNNTPLGQAKDKVSFEATITGVRFIEGDYGTTTLVKFSLASGQVASWFASNTWVGEGSVGLQVAVKATVKGTSEFRGDLETQLTRATVLPTGTPEVGEPSGYAMCWKCYGQATRIAHFVQGEVKAHIATCDRH